MKRPAALALLCFTALALPAIAQTYQWKDAQGRTVISDVPPPTSVKPTRTESPRPATAAPGSSDPSAAPSYAERELEFRKRQQEAREKAEKDAKEAAANAERKQNCERARSQLAALESGQRLSTFDANGERRFIDDEERRREIDRTRRYVADTCK